MLGEVGDHAVHTYLDGVQDGKTKGLMAPAITLGNGCRNGVLGRAMFALDKGAMQEEILETISMVAGVRGATGVAESLRVIQWPDELGTP